jgi:hypothetical protein
VRKWLASAEVLGARIQPSLRLSCADVPEQKPTPFGWNALINTQPGFGFKVEEDEDKV